MGAAGDTIKEVQQKAVSARGHCRGLRGQSQGFYVELMKIITSSFQRLQLIALRSEPRAKVAFTQASIAISSTFFL